jgi:hypothetical protein
MQLDGSLSRLSSAIALAVVPNFAAIPIRVFRRT